MILLGGLISWLVTRHKGGAPEEEHDAGSLFSSGLIAGDALTGILLALLTVAGLDKTLQLRDPAAGNFNFEACFATTLYLGLALWLYLLAKKKKRGLA
jgi:hypothetical protein